MLHQALFLPTRRGSLRASANADHDGVRYVVKYRRNKVDLIPTKGSQYRYNDEASLTSLCFENFPCNQVANFKNSKALKRDLQFI